MSKPTHEKLFLGDIEVPAGRRSLNEATVRDIADSMRAVGQLQPITVIDTGESYRLISGAHRVAAARLIADAFRSRNGRTIRESGLSMQSSFPIIGTATPA